MRVSLSLFGQWPYLKNADTDLEIFSSSDCPPDIYVTSTLKSQSINDILFSGGLFHIFRNMKYKIILITDCDLTYEEYNIIKSFEDSVDEFIMIGDIETLKMKLRTIKDDNVLVCNILCKLASPQELEKEKASSNHKVVNSVLLQKIANVAANETVNEICTSFSDSYSMCISYSSCEIVKENWECSNKAFALLPSGVITDVVMTNTNSLIVYALDKLDIDISNTDLSDTYDNNCAIIFDELDQNKYIVSHILYKGTKFVVYQDIKELKDSKDHWSENGFITASNSSNLLQTDWKYSEESTNVHKLFVTNLERLILKRTDPKTFLHNDTIISIMAKESKNIYEGVDCDTNANIDDSQSCHTSVGQDQTMDEPSSVDSHECSAIHMSKSTGDNPADFISKDVVLGDNVISENTDAISKGNVPEDVDATPADINTVDVDNNPKIIESCTTDLDVKDAIRDTDMNIDTVNSNHDSITDSKLSESQTEENIHLEKEMNEDNDSVNQGLIDYPQTTKITSDIIDSQQSSVISSVSSLSADSHPTSPSPSVSSEQKWISTIEMLISKQFGDKFADKIHTVCSGLKENKPYTLIISENYIFALIGIYPAESLKSMISSTLTLNLPTSDDNIVRIVNENGVPRIGKIKIDLESSIYFQNVLIYKEKEKTKPKEISNNTKNVNHTSNVGNKYSKGSVSKMNKRIELSRLLTHR